MANVLQLFELQKYHHTGLVNTDVTCKTGLRLKAKYYYKRKGPRSTINAFTNVPMQYESVASKGKSTINAFINVSMQYEIVASKGKSILFIN